MNNLALIVPVVFVAIIFISKWINILNEYERAVTFWLGRLSPQPKGPGLTFIFWPFETMIRISLRTVVLAVPPHDVITPDHVSVKFNDVVYVHVADPRRRSKVRTTLYATSQLSRNDAAVDPRPGDARRASLSRDKLNESLQEILDKQWTLGHQGDDGGAEGVDLPIEMQRAMASRRSRARSAPRSSTRRVSSRRASSSRPPRSSVASPRRCSASISADLTEIATEKNSTIIFLLPMDLISAFLKKDKA